MASQASVRGLRLLSIDGGGIRGLSPLFLLKQILYRIQHEKQLSDLPRPCDVFDLAGGTGTGGLIVIMLFRLQMSIDEAIHAYTTLTENTFSSKNWILGGYEDIEKIPRLLESMVSIVSQRSNGDPMLIDMVEENGPKCFVSTRHTKGSTLFRSWSNADQDHATIVQAAWATTRASLFSNVVEHNNPVKYVVEEANSLFPGRPISCVLSLGTGTAGVIGPKQPDAFQNVLPQNLIGLFKDIANECEKQSNAMEMQLRQKDNPDIYFRLNVDEGLQNVSLAEWDALNEVSAYTLRYLEKPDVGQKVDWLGQILKGDLEPMSSILHSAVEVAAATAEDVDLVPPTAPELSSITVALHRLPGTSTEDDAAIPSGVPEPSSIIVPLYRSPATSTPEDYYLVPSAVPDPSSISVPLSRLPITPIPEGGDVVPSAVADPSSITVPLDRLPATYTPEDNGFVPSAVPVPSSITVPVYRVPGTFTSGEVGDDFVPSVVPESLSATVPPATTEEGDFVLSAAPEPSAAVAPLIGLPATSAEDDSVPSDRPVPSSVTVHLCRPISPSLEDDGLVPSAAPEPSSIAVSLYRPVSTSFGDDGLVPSAAPEPSSITMPLFRLPATSSTLAKDDDFVSSAIPEPLSITLPLLRSPGTSSAEGDEFFRSAIPFPRGQMSSPRENVSLSNPDLRPLPDGWIQHYEASRQLWYYVQIARTPPMVTFMHPADFLNPDFRNPDPLSTIHSLYTSSRPRSGGNAHVPSTQPEPSSTTLVMQQPLESTSTAGGDETTSSVFPETILSKISPPAELSTSENETYFKSLKRFAPIAYRESPEGSASSICLVGTRKAEIEAIMKWIEVDEVKKPLFLVLGWIGTGKTTLLNNISQRSKADGYYAAGYFFSGTDHARNTPGRFINTITYQIAEAIPEFRPYVARIIEAGPSILDRSIESQTQRLLLEPLRQLKADYPEFSVRPHVIIIDALDECGELNDQIRVITALTELLKQEHISFLCLLSCGLNLPIAHEISTTHAALIHNRVILGKDEKTEKADIWAYLGASFTRIRDKHVLRTHIPNDWPAESDLETIVKRSGGLFIYPATIIRHLESTSNHPHEELGTILQILTTKSEVDPLAELDGLYQTLMSLVENLTGINTAQILGLHLVRASPNFWIPKTVEYAGTFNFENHFRSLNAEFVLAPLASVLECAGGHIRFYHLSFAQFLLDPARSGKYFVQPETWQHKVVSQLVQAFYDREQILPEDIEYLIKEVKPGTKLHQLISDSFKQVVGQPIRLPFGGVFNIWPFVTSGFFDQLQFAIPIGKIAAVFLQRAENALPLPILIKLASTCQLSNSFLLIELCRTCASLLKKGFIQESGRFQEKGFDSEDDPHFTSPNRLLLFMSYLADYLDDQHRAGKKVLLPQDYLSASLRCLWYLQSSYSDIRSSLKGQLRSLTYLPETFGIYDHLDETSSSTTLGALNALPTFLLQAPPSSELLATLKQPFDGEITSKMPSSSRNALGVIHDYLMKHDPEYQQSEHTVLTGLDDAREDDTAVDFEVFLHRRGSKIPEWVNND